MFQIAKRGLHSFDLIERHEGRKDCALSGVRLIVEASHFSDNNVIVSPRIFASHVS
jgi:hypothetical protein